MFHTLGRGLGKLLGLLICAGDMEDRGVRCREVEVPRAIIAHDEPAAPADLNKLAAAHHKAIDELDYLQV